jgi:hypothetical protein
MTFDHILTQTCTVIDVTGRSASGDPTFGAPRTVACRYESSMRRRRSASGDFIEPWKNVVYVAEEIAKGSLVFPPGVDTSNRNNALPVTYVGFSSTPDGADTLYEVYL